jgi:hypothetical protein
MCHEIALIFSLQITNCQIIFLVKVASRNLEIFQDMTVYTQVKALRALQN